LTARAVLVGCFATVVLVCAGCAISQTRQPTQPLTVDITVAQGKVTPTNAQLQATVGQQIVLRVSSDAADELHVHTVPDHTFTVEPRRGQQFRFSTDVPGRVDVELHRLDRTVATIDFRP
jgi:hypothetical protein